MFKSPDSLLIFCVDTISVIEYGVSSVQFISVQSLSRMRLSVVWDAWTVACQASLSNINSQSLLKLMSIELVMPSNHFILCHSLLLLPSVFPSIRVFPNESVLRIRWLKYWSFSFSISPSNEYSGLISFRTDWLDLLVAQGTLKSLLQHHSSKASWSYSYYILLKDRLNYRWSQNGDCLIYNKRYNSHDNKHWLFSLVTEVTT